LALLLATGASPEPDVQALVEDPTLLIKGIEPDDANAIAPSIDESARTLTLRRGQLPTRFRDGGYRWSNAQSMPEAQGVDNIVWYGRFVEVQDYKRIESALRAREHQFRLIVENANDIIYTVNAEGTVTYASPNWTTMLGHATSEVHGRPLEAFVYSDDQPQWRVCLCGVLSRGKKKTNLEFRIRHANGDLRWYKSNAAPIRDDEIRAVVYLGIGRDITSRRIAEQEQRYQLRFQRLVAQILSAFRRFWLRQHRSADRVPPAQHRRVIRGGSQLSVPLLAGPDHHDEYP
jgi:PAS domain S-box-containing protein